MAALLLLIFGLLPGESRADGGPVITAQPVPQSVEGGQQVAIKVVATTTVPPLSYQWCKDGKALETCKMELIYIGSAQPADAGEYYVIITDDNGASVTSAKAKLTVGAAPAAAAPTPPQQIEAAGPNLVGNGGFEEGVEGYGYEQWDKKPVPGTVDGADAVEGKCSFKMGLPGTKGGRWISKEVAVEEPGKDHTLSFALKLKGVPEDAARVRLAIDGKGFLRWGDIVRTGGTFDWTTFTIPVSAKEIGNAKKVVIFFYDDAMDSGTMGIDALSFAKGTVPNGKETPRSVAFGYNGLTLKGSTSRSDVSTFAVGEPVSLEFTASGLLEAKEPVTLDLSIVDEHEVAVDSRSIPINADEKGCWKTKIEAPHSKLGFYRVYAKLSTGTPLHGAGSRPAGFLTYIVVPDPAKRIDYGEENTFFAMQGASSAAAKYLGVRWVLDDSLFWRRMEPDRAGQFGSDQAQKYIGTPFGTKGDLPVFTLPTLCVVPSWAAVPGTLAYETGKLSPEGEKAWAAYCTAAAQAYAAKNPDRKHRIYQITWEPIAPWGFKGTDADLIRIYEIAYPALHAADPSAIVAGPCRGIWNNGDPTVTARLLKLGLGKYMDAYIAHPYFTITPEKDGMIQSIRSMKETLASTTGKNLPMYGSEQGWSTDEDISKEVEQARGLLRQNLITFGEGFSFNFAFIYYDYRMSGSRSGYGYYYNLDEGVPFGPRTVSPKPIAAAYSAQSMLLEGSKSQGAIEGLGNSSWGYAFERADGVTLALWNYGKTPREVSIPTGAKEVRIFDWMGNESATPTQAGMLTIKLGQEPIYVTGVSANLWGKAGANVLAPETKRLNAFPGGRVTLKGKSLLPSDKPFVGKVAVESEPAGTFKQQSQSVALGTNRAASFEFSLDVPSTMHPGEHPVNLRLFDAAGNTIKTAALSVVVEPPIAVTTDAAFAADGKPALAVALNEKQGRAASGTVDVWLKELLPGADRGDAPMIDLVVDPGKTKDVPGTHKQVKFDLVSRGAKRLLVDFPEADLAPAKRYQALVTITTTEGTTFSDTVPVHFLGASKLPKPVTVDGNLSEWQSFTPVSLNGPQDVVRAASAYPKGFAAKLWFAWDEQALYIAAEVQDDLFVQSFEGTETWKNDSIQLGFNLDPQLPGREPTPGAQRTSEITVALTPKGPQACRDFSYAMDKLPAGVLPPEQFKIEVKRSGPGTAFYEMTIPWATLGFTGGPAFKSGDAIGIAATVNEVRKETQGDPCALGLFKGIYPDKNPDKYGVLILK